MCQRALVQRPWARQRVVSADEVKELGLPTYRANIIRHNTRELIRLPAFRRTHFYHAFEPVIPPTTPGVL
jgi:hypothetical protein